MGSADWAQPTVQTGNKLGWEASAQEETATDAIESHVQQAEEAATGVPRKLRSDQTWLHPSLAHGKSIDFVNGGLAAQQEDMEAAIEQHEAAAESAGSDDGGGRRLLLARGVVRP